VDEARLEWSLATDLSVRRTWRCRRTRSRVSPMTRDGSNTQADLGNALGILGVTVVIALYEWVYGLPQHQLLTTWTIIVVAAVGTIGCDRWLVARGADWGARVLVKLAWAVFFTLALLTWFYLNAVRGLL
jgi:hypothetical protein